MPAGGYLGITLASSGGSVGETRGRDYEEESIPPKKKQKNKKNPEIQCGTNCKTSRVLIFSLTQLIKRGFELSNKTDETAKSVFFKNDTTARGEHKAIYRKAGAA